MNCKHERQRWISADEFICEDCGVNSDALQKEVAFTARNEDGILKAEVS